jgi:outer membrane protein OmpU
MRRLVLASALAALFTAPCAHAQSSVTVYGILDAGITMLSNASGHQTWLFGSGVQQANRYGFKGSEDLGGGTRAIFTLENGFSLNDGSLKSSGEAFSRQAYVGLSSSYGTVTLGRQFDFMAQNLAGSTTAAYIGGLYAWHLGDADRLAGEELNNAVKYLSPEIAGLTYGVMYSFGGVPGHMDENSGWSAGVKYAVGALKLGAAFTNAEDTQTPVFGLSKFGGMSVKPGALVSLNRTTNFGIGGSYDIGPATLHAIYTWNQFVSPTVSLVMRIYEGGASYWITPALTVGAGYTYSSMSPNHWGEATAGADYFLSKRTDVYLTLNSIHASGPHVVAMLPTLSPSSNRSQTAVRIGMRTKF